MTDNTVAFKILSRFPFAGGAEFGTTGSYEVINARVDVGVDPLAQHSGIIFDIANAERSDDGLVHAQSDVWILKPVEAGRGNGTLLCEFPNRGNKRNLQFFNDAPASNTPSTLAHAGNGFLLKQGYTVMCAAWQGDVLAGDDRLTASLPLAVANGKPLVGRIKVEFVIDAPGKVSLPLSGASGTRSYPAVSLDNSTAVLSRRRYPGATAETVPSSAWSFGFAQGGRVVNAAGDITGGELGVVPSREHIYIAKGFEPGWIYDLVYDATDPLVLDMGYAAIRDIVDFLRSETAADNPLAHDLPKRVIGWGRSQSGRSIRDYIHRGFNAGIRSTRVFDGMMPHISGAGKTNMNRFTNLVIAASRQYEDWTNPSDQFPFSYASSTDHITGRTDAICKRPESDPHVIHTHTASEYWHRRGSLVHTDTQGNDLEQPETVRVYFWSSSQHWAEPQHRKPETGICQNYQNVVATSPFFRGTLELMNAWLTKSEAPPPSRIPRVSDGTLVDMEQWRSQFPHIPGIALPRSFNELFHIDYGQGYDRGEPVIQPLRVDFDKRYVVRIPAVDVDGNDVAGLRAPMVEAPLGTYTGWNLRIRGLGHGALHGFSGSYIPFSETREEAVLMGDPRPPVKDRFDDPSRYSDAIEQAAKALAGDGFLVADDVQAARNASAGWGRPRHDIRL